MSVGFAGLFSGIGTGVGDFLAAGADRKQAGTYQQASDLETQNEQIEKASVSIQQAQQQRQEYRSESATVADAAGNGLAARGSAGDILRSSAQQGALARSLVGAQGQINENGFAAQAGAYRGEAAAANAAATGKEIAGATSILGGFFGL